MQNLFVLAALRPKRVLQVASNNDLYVKKAEDLKSAYELFCKKEKLQVPEFIPVSMLDSPTPSIKETKYFIEQLYCSYSDLEINYTGGTKQMSIAAYLVALEKQLPSWYCDTQQGLILEGETDKTNKKTFKINQIFSNFDCRIIMAANGNSTEMWYSTTALNDDQKKLGKRIYDLLLNEEAHFTEYMKNVSDKVNPNNLMLPNPPNQEIIEYLLFASQLNLVQFDNNIFTLLVEKKKKLSKKTIENSIKRIYGDPFEFFVHTCLLKSSRYFDVRRSVVTKDVSSETDFICLDRESKSLVLISCKVTSAGAKLEHIESLIQRKNWMGGIFTKAILCVGKNYLAGDELQKKCRLFNVQLLVGSEIENYFNNQK
jgi:hypothetical protein